MGRLILSLPHGRQLGLSVICLGRVTKAITQRLSQLCPSPGTSACIILPLKPKLRSPLQQGSNIGDLRIIITT